MDGEYALRAVDPGWRVTPISAAATLPARSASASLAVGARLLSENAAAWVLLACHAPGDGRDTGYRLEVEPVSASFSLWRSDDGSRVELSKGNDLSIIRRGGAVNS